MDEILSCSVHNVSYYHMWQIIIKSGLLLLQIPTIQDWQKRCYDVCIWYFLQQSTTLLIWGHSLRTYLLRTILDFGQACCYIEDPYHRQGYAVVRVVNWECHSKIVDWHNLAHFVNRIHKIYQYPCMFFTTLPIV